MLTKGVPYNIIAGCNGAGKTTASYTILPEILDCNEFVNADEIARGLSPFRPEKAGIQAGRLMLQRIKSLISKGQDFAFETTLSTKSYKNLVEDAQRNGYSVTLIFFYLSSQDLAIKRVETRVKEGGHNIPEKVIRKRCENGLKNFFNIFRPIVDEWLFIENSGEPYKLIAQKKQSDEKIYIDKIWNQLKTKYDGK
ncbi:zeta toxin family protein [Pricia sp.]|uniref:zeta toxin family protein n=1 Tax=Pricia sp. TaxID=2268138 RepID=UPI0035949413